MRVMIATAASGRVTVEHGWKALAAGASPLDALQAGLMAAEADETLTDIGYGGMPDASGRLSLDAALMDGPTHRAGAVAGLYGCKHPVAVARKVMEKTPHVFLVGQGARDFATAQGFPDEGPLLTPHAAAEFAKFQRGEIPPQATGELYHSDTVGAVALVGDAMAAGTSTSGLGFKLPGRVGDSPIIGSGLYLENEVGGAVCLGMGEQMMQVCLAFRVVSAMARGLSPQDATIEGVRALRKHRPHLTEMSCLTIALSRSGEYAGACTLPNPGLCLWVASDTTDGLLEIPATYVPCP